MYVALCGRTKGMKGRLWLLIEPPITLVHICYMVQQMLLVSRFCSREGAPNGVLCATDVV